eukprot:TRINITY_DN11132_c0_g1_i1.p1 TRINITY_DN11132_c0_g1~~TRINITY_DN11132_c0_g1_i1.p1  ORF type:complete len:487 (+),score=178.67 TRINITY_DN11132_c0_g1_i1:52-1512(+)
MYNKMLKAFLVLALASMVIADEQFAVNTDGKNVYFFEDFANGFGNFEVILTDRYQGQFVSRDEGLVIDEKAKHYAAVARFPLDHSNTDKDLIVQYQVKFEKGSTCGGSYIKLLAKDTLSENNDDIDNETPYVIMFGPDKCGANNKVHFIIRHQNPVSGEWEEKHLADTPTMPSGTKTHLYTLVVSPDNTYEIYVDMELESSGSLLEDFEPSINPSKTIDDPNDVKPETWVDEAQIPDPEDEKPEDWDEDAPQYIPDTEDVKPEDWLDNEPDYIPDPEAQKPDDWDDELDGDWEAPLVPNPVCYEAGCGEWEPRQIPNPEYKGTWYPQMIDNPDYIGEWTPKQIDNPHYFVDEQPTRFPEIGALLLELWTMDEGIIFDNFLITSDRSIADNYAKQTWQVIHEEEHSQNQSDFMEQVNQFVEAGLIFAQDENNLPVVVGSAVIAVVIPLLVCACTGSKKQDDDSSDEEPEEEEKSKKKSKKRRKKVQH